MSDELFEGIGADVWRLQAHFSHRVNTAAKIDHLNATGGIAISFAPHRRGSVHLNFDGSQSKNLSIWTTQSKHGFLSVPKFKSELYSIRFVACGSIFRKNRQGGEYTGGPGHATFLAFDDMIEDRASADFEALTATVTRRAILLACEALEGSKPQRLPHFIPIVEAKSSAMLALRQTLYALHCRFKSGIGESDFIFPLMEEILVYQLVSAWPKLDGTVRHSAEVLNTPIRLAIDYIEANLAKKITIAEIAGIAGVGVRSLQMSFRRQIGCTPVEFIINRRLEQAHEMLRCSDGNLTIRHIATQWGFAHMSDFSRRYRQRYGHVPKMSRST